MFISISHWFSIRGNFALQRTFGNVRRYFWLSQCGRGVLAASNVLRDAAKHLTKHRTAALVTKNYKTLNVSCAEAEKL